MPWKPETHKPHGHARPRDNRPGARQRGYTGQWEKVRLAYLRDNPLCVDCLAAGLYVTATDVDHIEPHRGDEGRFWDPANLQSLCKSHHSRKTRRGE